MSLKELLTSEKVVIFHSQQRQNYTGFWMKPGVMTVQPLVLLFIPMRMN